MCNRCANACRSRILLVLLMFCLRSSVPICGWRAVISEWLLACLGVFSKRKLRGVYTLSCKANCHLYRIIECVRSLRATSGHVLRTDDWENRSDANRSRVPTLVQTSLVGVDRC